MSETDPNQTDSPVNEPPRYPEGYVPSPGMPPPQDSHWDRARKWHQTRTGVDPRSKNPSLAGFLSVMPGLGQIYTGYYPQGFVNIVVIGSLISLLNQGLGPIHPLGVFFVIFYWLFNIVDSYRKATLYNHTLAGLGPLEIPEQPEPTDTKGTLLGGLLLTGFGLAALAHTVLDLQTDWMEDWWPAVLIIIGGYLIIKSFLFDKKKEDLK